ncbi:MAG: hypothetical protein GKR94_23940 [Gammaproteobacteria bacterium]|nr:hypothetical protein [Gammaproteobacteria bacterium]
MRRGHFAHGRSLRWLARHDHVHRRTVRQALNSTAPPERRTVKRRS